MPKTVCIVGGGAAGFFAAIECAQKIKDQKLDAHVQLLEGSSRYLQKVRISGGGRCNVTHHDFHVRSFASRYPRGEKEVLSPMSQFQAQDLVAWFEGLGVNLKVEEDGRMFPVTDNSETIIDCLKERAKALGVKTIKNTFVDQLAKDENQFVIKTRAGDSFVAEVVMLATGSNAAGYNMATSLGHRVTPLAPSLFSFKISNPLLEGLQGISFPRGSVLLRVSKKKFDEQAPLLITHWGLSGPGILKISAWAAREMKECDYKAQLVVNWVGRKQQDVQEYLLQIKSNQSKLQLDNVNIKAITKRFWKRVLEVSRIDGQKPIGEISNKDLEQIANVLTKSTLQIDGKNRFKDEFVECGGIDLREINMKTMESKIVPGLFFGGEIMDVDGVTGGFNLQHAWTSGYVAGQHMSKKLEGYP